MTMTKHMTLFADGDIRGGIKHPARDGLSHTAWKVFDAMVEIDSEDGTVRLPTKAEARDAAVNTHGLNRGNVDTEFGRWKKFNNFA